MRIKIRYATARDIGDLKKLDKAANSELKWWEQQSKSDFLKILKRSRNSILIAICDGKAVGYLQGSPDLVLQKAFIEDVYVMKDYRKLGIAKALVNKFVEFWHKRKKTVALITEDKNLHIFGKLKFRKVMNWMENR